MSFDKKRVSSIVACLHNINKQSTKLSGVRKLPFLLYINSNRDTAISLHTNSHRCSPSAINRLNKASLFGIAVTAHSFPRTSVIPKLSLSRLSSAQPAASFVLKPYPECFRNAVISEIGRLQTISFFAENDRVGEAELEMDKMPA